MDTHRLRASRVAAYCKPRWRILLKAAIALALFQYSDPLSAIRFTMSMPAPQIVLLIIGSLAVLIYGAVPILSERKDGSK